MKRDKFQFTSVFVHTADNSWAPTMTPYVARIKIIQQEEQNRWGLTYESTH